MVLTVGHSNRTLSDFLALLAAHQVELLADVRAVPASRAHPHFAREPLDAALAGAGIGYLWIPELGGRRPRPRGAPPRFGGWTEPGFQAYEAHMRTPEFEVGLARLLEAVRSGSGSRGTGEQRVAVMCAEAPWWRCHRSMIGDALAAREVPVLHILDDREVPHPLAERRGRYAPGVLAGG